MSQQVARRLKCVLATVEVASIHPYQFKPIRAHSLHRCFFFKTIISWFYGETNLILGFVLKLGAPKWIKSSSFLRVAFEGPKHFSWFYDIQRFQKEDMFRRRWCMTHTHICIYLELEHLFINGCFNWMIPNHYMKDCCFTKHPFNNGCLGYQVYIHHNQVAFWFSDITTRRRDCNFFFLKGWVWSA